MKNYYEILEVDVKASKEIIDKAFKVLAKKYHPDTQSEQKKEWAEAKFKEINEAYEVLSNEASRKDYDSELDYDKNSYIEAIINKNEHLEHLVVELQNEISYLKNQTNSNNFSNTNNRYENPFQDNYQYEANQNPNFNQANYNIYYDAAPEETIYFETHIPYHKNKLKDILAFFITIICIIGLRIFTLENTFYK